MSTQKTASQSTPTTTSTPDSWETRIKAAATFMGLTIEQVELGLKDLGVEKEPSGLEMLSDENITPFGDIRAIFCEKVAKIPIAKVRLAMKYLRGPQGSKKTDTIDPEIMALKAKYGIRMRLEDVDPSELLENYHPELPNHPVTTALKKRFGDKQVIIFKPDSKIVDIEATANYITDIEQGLPEEETVESDGVLVRVYAVGEVPNQMVEEDPLFADKPLKRGRSIVNRINWTDIPLQVRQMCRVIVDRDDIDLEDRFQVQELMKLAQQGIKELRRVYPEADLDCREMAQKNALPTLVLTMESANGKRQDPFNVGNRRF